MPFSEIVISRLSRGRVSWAKSLNRLFFLKCKILKCLVLFCCKKNSEIVLFKKFSNMRQFHKGISHIFCHWNAVKKDLILQPSLHSFCRTRLNHEMNSFFFYASHYIVLLIVQGSACLLKILYVSLRYKDGNLAPLGWIMS